MGRALWTRVVDFLGRVTQEIDPDGIVQSVMSWYPDCSLATSQSFKQSYPSTVTYDADGDVTTDAHYGSVHEVTTKYYDGADRLVEVLKPVDPRSWPASTPWTGQLEYGRGFSRYDYDLTQGGTVTVDGSAAHAYGNLFATYSASPNGPTLTKEMSYDALDRPIHKHIPDRTTLAYDTAPNGRGLLATETNGVGESKQYRYDALGREVGVT